MIKVDKLAFISFGLAFMMSLSSVQAMEPVSLEEEPRDGMKYTLRCHWTNEEAQKRERNLREGNIFDINCFELFRKNIFVTPETALMTKEGVDKQEELLYKINHKIWSNSSNCHKYLIASCCGFNWFIDEELLHSFQ